MADAPAATQVVQDDDRAGVDRSRTIDASILYVGTPVVLISTRNRDGSANLAPTSSAGLTPLAADLVGAPRVSECPIQLEARVTAIRQLGGPEGRTVSVEVKVVRTHVHEAVLLPGHRHHIDPDKWRPLIMSFLEFHRLGRRVHPSRLAEVF